VRFGFIFGVALFGCGPSRLSRTEIDAATLPDLAIPPEVTTCNSTGEHLDVNDPYCPLSGMFPPTWTVGGQCPMGACCSSGVKWWEFSWECNCISPENRWLCCSDHNDYCPEEIFEGAPCCYNNVCQRDPYSMTGRDGACIDGRWHWLDLSSPPDLANPPDLSSSPDLTPVCPPQATPGCMAPGDRCPDGTPAILPPGGCCAVCA
jgi:hypothetical protein